MTKGEAPAARLLSGLAGGDGEEICCCSRPLELLRRWARCWRRSDRSVGVSAGGCELGLWALLLLKLRWSWLVGY